MKIITFVIVAFSINTLYSQQFIMCPSLGDILIIENTDDVPIVTTNGDGTITLNHVDPLINDVFMGYQIFEFEATFPGTTDPFLQKIYNITHNSRQLIEDIQSTIPISRISIEKDYTPIEAINPSLIDFVNGKEFDLVGYTSTDDTGGCTFDCPFEMATQDFYARFSFDYNESDNLLYIETIGETTCGNQFSIALDAGYDDFGSTNDNTLQTWTVLSGINSTSNPADECYIFESVFYSLLDINCGGGLFESIRYLFDIDSGELIFKKRNALFGENTVLLKDATLGTDENKLNDLIIFETDNNPYLQVANTNNQDFNLRVFDLNGREVIDKTALIDNTINISALQKGTLYLFEIVNVEGNRNIVKFIKR